MNELIAIALSGFRESRRNRVTVVVFLFAFVMIFATTFALELTVSTFERVMTDVGLGVMSLISVFLAIFLATGLLPREVERRTVYMVVTKPVGRSKFVIGRLLGNLVTLTFVMAIMAVLFVAQMVINHATLTQAHAFAIAGLFLEVVVLSAVGFMFAAGSSQFVATVTTVGIYFVGHLAPDLYRMSNRTGNVALKWVGKAGYYLLPNLDRLDFKARATYAEATTLAELGGSAAYALGYACIAIMIACFIFERRDFK